MKHPWQMGLEQKHKNPCKQNFESGKAVGVSLIRNQDEVLRKVQKGDFVWENLEELLI